jgi:mono/diheme cytochrome c family protein
MGANVKSAMLAAVFGWTVSVVAMSGEQVGGTSDAKAMKNPVPASAAAIEDGKKVYMKQCRMCHGDSGKGDGPMAPEGSMPADFTDAKWDHGSGDGEIFKIISDGVGKDSPMKGFKSKLTAKEMWSLVHYLRSLNPNSKPQ